MCADSSDPSWHGSGYAACAAATELLSGAVSAQNLGRSHSAPHTLVSPPPQPQWHQKSADFPAKFQPCSSGGTENHRILGTISRKVLLIGKIRFGKCFTRSWAQRCVGSWSSTRRCTRCTTPWSQARWPWATNTVRSDDYFVGVCDCGSYNHTCYLSHTTRRRRFPDTKSLFDVNVMIPKLKFMLWALAKYSFLKQILRFGANFENILCVSCLPFWGYSEYGGVQKLTDRKCAFSSLSYFSLRSCAMEASWS